MAMEASNLDIQAYIPNDLIVNILSRLPSKSLLRFKSVCKSWYSLINHDTVFHALHLRNSNSNTNGDSPWLAKRWQGEFYCLYGSHFWVYDFPYSSKIQPYHVPTEPKLPFRMVTFSGIVGWCDGVVAISQNLENLGNLICLWNPSIRKCKKVFLPWNKITNKSRFKPQLNKSRFNPPLPSSIYEPDPWLMSCGLGLDVGRKEYKFVVVCPGNDKEVSHVFVYSLKTDKWTKIDIDLKPIGTKFTFNVRKLHATYVNGACHWIRTDLRRMKDIVLSFNLNGHHISYIDLPPKSPPCGYGDDSFTMSVWKDTLSVWEITEMGTMSVLKIWVIKDYPNTSSSSCSWTLIKKVYLKENKYCSKNMFMGIERPGDPSWDFTMHWTPTMSNPFIDSPNDNGAEELKKYIAASLDGLVPFQESLVLP